MGGSGPVNNTKRTSGTTRGLRKTVARTPTGRSRASVEHAGQLLELTSRYLERRPTAPSVTTFARVPAPLSLHPAAQARLRSIDSLAQLRPHELLSHGDVTVDRRLATAVDRLTDHLDGVLDDVDDDDALLIAVLDREATVTARIAAAAAEVCAGLTTDECHAVAAAYLAIAPDWIALDPLTQAAREYTNVMTGLVHSTRLPSLRAALAGLLDDFRHYDRAYHVMAGVHFGIEALRSTGESIFELLDTLPTAEPMTTAEPADGNRQVTAEVSTPTAGELAAEFGIEVSTAVQERLDRLVVAVHRRLATDTRLPLALADGDHSTVQHILEQGMAGLGVAFSEMAFADFAVIHGEVAEQVQTIMGLYREIGPWYHLERALLEQLETATRARQRAEQQHQALHDHYQRLVRIKELFQEMKRYIADDDEDLRALVTRLTRWVETAGTALSLAPPATPLHRPQLKYLWLVLRADADGRWAEQADALEAHITALVPPAALDDLLLEEIAIQHAVDREVDSEEVLLAKIRASLERYAAQARHINTRLRSDGRRRTAHNRYREAIFDGKLPEQISDAELDKLIRAAK